MNKDKTTQNIFHVISNTHWDREWRFPFQRNRQMLTDMIDKVLEILETEPEYRAFHLDSQSIVLKDYLEIKPHKKDQVVELTRQNRLLHGPWYILPEEFQVGGENLVRNLLLGHRVSRQHGGVSKIGYSPFSWGQISQLPQIYRQFNIHLIMFYRGVNSLDSPKAEFLWEGADKTRMISSRFSTMPRYNFYFYIYRPVVHNEGFYDVEYPWQKGTTPFHFADAQQQDEDYFIISPHSSYYPENIEPQVQKIIEDQADDFTTPHKIWMEGHDSSGPNRQTVDILNDIRKKIPGINVRHSTLEEYAEMIAKDVEPENLKLVKGERRSSQNDNRCGNLFGYTTSARMYLKQANFDAERWIQYYAEPFNIFSSMLGRDIKDTYPETTWELIIQNSAHDSIGGCSLDRIHEDMMMRYKHAVEISKGVFERAAKYMLGQLSTHKFSTHQTNGIFLTGINPTNYNTNGSFEVFVDIPAELDKGDFEIETSEGEKLRKSILWRKSHQPVLEQMINRPMFFNMIRYHAYLSVQDIPAFGLKTLQIIPKKEEKEKSASGFAENQMENQFLKIEVNEDGSLNMLDKNSNTHYKNIAWFEDHGEAGHAWVLKRTDPTVTTIGSKAKITKTYQTELFQQISITHTLILPKNLQTRTENTGETVENTLIMKVSLAKDQKYAEINVEIDNQAESHRLRLMVPTHLRATHSWGEGQFDVVKRSLERPDTSDWIEQPMYDFPMHHFADVSDENKGIALLSDGLKEYEVLPDPEKTLAITLFRTFEYKINPSAPQDYSHEKGSQMLGRSRYRMALYPHTGNWEEGEVYKQSWQFNYPVRWVQTGKLNGSLGHTAQFMKIKPEKLVFSTLKKPENDNDNSMILRIFNPTGKILEGNVELLTPLLKAEKVNLEEIPMKEDLQLDKNSFSVKLSPKEIGSYYITFKPETTFNG